MRVAIATTFFYDDSHSLSACGLVKWCYSARSLASSPAFQASTDAVIFSNDAQAVEAECSNFAMPSPRVILYPLSIVELAKRWASAAAVGWTHGQRISKPTSRQSAKQMVLKFYALFKTKE